jgi:predicted lipoprotein with Yx(FWY)xxD motif
VREEVAALHPQPPPRRRRRREGLLLEALRRRDGGLQATYAGRPLHYYVGDKKPGQIFCQKVS